MDIKIGDRVKLSPKSGFYRKNASSTSSNPIHVLGTYIEYHGDGTVEWDNGRQNGCYGTTTYAASHLIFVNKIHELWV
jgi:hypothetical protein